ncbi:MAG: FliA/WhiG family RNA polymerase sigma factor [Candidatus Brocadiia bacterium]
MENRKDIRRGGGHLLMDEQYQPVATGLVSERSAQEVMAQAKLADKQNTRKLWEKFKRTGAKQYHDQLVKIYLPIVRQVAEKMSGHLPGSVDVQDLSSAGIFGLLDAIKLFDLDRGIKFETYCVNRIRGAMLDELREMDWVPRLVRTRSHQLSRSCKHLQEKLGRAPTDFEIAKNLNLNLDEYNKMAQDACAFNMFSLNATLGSEKNEQSMEFSDVLKCRKDEFSNKKVINKEIVEYLKSRVSQKERLVLELYFDDDLTMKEIGLILDISESRVSQIFARVITRLQTQFKRHRSEWLS